MKSKVLIGSAALAVGACAILLSGQPASAGSHYYSRPVYYPWAYYSRSKYYPWAGQFPWDQRLTVNPDVISGRLMSTSIYWPALSGYAFYCSTFPPSYGCRPGTYAFWGW